MHKSSFSLLETIVSITLILIIITGFSKISFDDKKDSKYMLLDKIQNSFTTKDYSNFSSSNEKIKVTINSTLEEEITVSKKTFLNDEIKIFKYEL